MCITTFVVASPARAENAIDPCAKATEVARPAPGSAGRAPKNCDPLTLYDGVGGKPDYRAARACALEGGEDDFLGAAAVLAMIYANGEGVTRDDDLAIAYACDAGGAPAEISGRIDNLSERKRAGAAAERFDFCDDITSGLMQGACAQRESRKITAIRVKDIAALTAKLPPKAKTAYAALNTAFSAYRSALTENEVDISGTARGAMIVEAQEDEDKAFIETLRFVIAGSPSPAVAPLAKADAALNAAYKTVQALDGKGMWGTVTTDGIRTPQRVWLPYRDAFIAFAMAARSETAAEQVAARLTERRTQNLRRFAHTGAR